MKKITGVLLFLVAFIAAQAQIACLPGSLSTGIMAFYPFSSGSISDFSGGAHHLSNPTTASPVTDRFGNPNCAYHFVKAAGDYLHVPMPGAAFVNGLTTAPFSISLWFHGAEPAGNFEVLIGRGVPGGSAHCPDTWQQWSMSLSDCRQPVAGFDRRNTWVDWWGLPDCSLARAHFTDNWRHLALVYTGTSRKLYLDGVPFSVVGDTCGPLTMDLNDLVLGNEYTGDLDDIIIYNRALTAGEVSSLYGASACCGTTIPTSVPAGSVTTSIGIKIYPNPSDNRISVSSNGGLIRSVSLYTCTGAEYAAYSFNLNDVSIDIDAFAPGMYFVKVITDSETTIEKLIKK